MYEYKVLAADRIVDGDTYDIWLDLGFYQRGLYRVRLLGVDTPEVYGKNATPEGTEVKEFVEDWFQAMDEGGLAVRARTVKTDSFGRWLADIFVVSPDGVTIGLADTLLNLGYAVPYSR